jgi:hypothetical protein
VEVEGQTVAWLVDPQWEEMFWASYRVVPVSADESWRAKVQTEEFWRNTDPVIRFRDTGWINPHTFPGGLFRRDERGRLRVNMRSLHLPRARQSLCDRWVLRQWRKRRQQRKSRLQWVESM